MGLLALGLNVLCVISLDKFLLHLLSHWMDGETEAEVGKGSSSAGGEGTFQHLSLCLPGLQFHTPCPFLQQTGKQTHYHVLISKQSCFCCEFIKINLLAWLEDLLDIQKC